MNTRRIEICTDAACNLSEAWLEAHDVSVLTFSVSLDGRECTREMIDDPDRFYDAIRQGARPFTSSLPNGVVEGMFKDVLRRGRDVLYIGVPASLSSNFQRVQDIVADVSAGSEHEICCMDARIAVMGHALLVEEAVRLRDAGKTLAEIRPALEWLSDHIRIFFMLDDPQYLKSGGRGEEALSWAARFASRLSVKPVLVVDHRGALKFHSVYRSRKRAIAQIMERLCALRDPRDDLVIYAQHAGMVSLAEQLADEVRATLGPQQRVEVGHIPLPIGAHVGPGAGGLVFLGATSKVKGSLD